MTFSVTNTSDRSPHLVRVHLTVFVAAGARRLSRHPRWEQGRDLGDPDELRALAAEAGLHDIEPALQNEALARRVEDQRDPGLPARLAPARAGRAAARGVRAGVCPAGTSLRGLHPATLKPGEPSGCNPG